MQLKGVKRSVERDDPSSEDEQRTNSSSSASSPLPSFNPFPENPRRRFVVRVAGKQYEFPIERECHIHELLSAAETSFRSVEQEIIQNSYPHNVLTSATNNARIKRRSHQATSASNNRSIGLSRHDSVETLQKTKIKVPFRIQTRISDDNAIRRGYQATFVSMQQAPIKLLLKSWIQVIEPNKQKNYPYRTENRPEKRPFWWPDKDKSRFKEPDHLVKPECIWVATYIFEHVIAETDPRVIERLAEKTFKLDLHMENERQEKFNKRFTLLTQLFSNAKLHQQYKSGVVGGEEMIIFSFDETPATIEKIELDARKKKKIRVVPRDNCDEEDEGDEAHENEEFDESLVKEEVEEPVEREKSTQVSIPRKKLKKLKHARSEDPGHCEGIGRGKRQKIVDTRPHNHHLQPDRASMCSYIYPQPSSHSSSAPTNSWPAVDTHAIIPPGSNPHQPLVESSSLVVPHTHHDSEPVFVHAAYQSPTLHSYMHEWPTNDAHRPSISEHAVTYQLSHHHAHPFDASTISFNSTIPSSSIQEFAKSEFVPTGTASSIIPPPSILEFQTWHPPARDA